MEPSASQAIREPLDKAHYRFFAAFRFRAFDVSIATRRSSYAITVSPTTKDNHDAALSDSHFLRDESILSDDRRRFNSLLRDQR